VKNPVIHVIEILLGVVLLCLGMMYLSSRQEALMRLTGSVIRGWTRDRSIVQQYNNSDIYKVADEEVCAAIMGYRQYPIMVDGMLIPADGYDYDLYFECIKDGYYRKEYRFSKEGHITMIMYTYIGF